MSMPQQNRAAVVQQLAHEFWRFAALHAVVDLGCADHLKGGPLPVDELAERCGADARALHRLLRVLTGTGLFAMTGPKTYALTETGEVLCSDAPDSMRPAIVAGGEPASWMAMNALPSVARAGAARPVEPYSSYYEYLADNPAAGQVFDEFMRMRSTPIAAGLATGYDFPESGTIVDLGGGKGQILAAVLRAHPGLRGALLERPNVLPRAHEYLTEQGLADRCDLVPGDFFAAVPEGADLYLLANVLHNWDDEDALQILKNVRAALPEHGRLLIVDMVLPDGDEPHPGKFLDIRMLALFGEGGERTEAEYTELLGRAGLTGRRVTELAIRTSLLEVRATG